MRLFLTLAMVGGMAGSFFADSNRRTFAFVDLQPWGNRKITLDAEEGKLRSDLSAIPAGFQTFGDVRFNIGEKFIQLGSTAMLGRPEKVKGISVGLRAEKLHFLHATGFGGGTNRESSPWHVKDGTLIGEYRVNFEDRSAIIIPIVYGEDVRDWFYIEDEKGPSKGKVVWEGDNELAQKDVKGIRLYLSTWENPWPEKRVTSIDYSSKKEETVAAPFCAAITVEGQQPR
jgi:hypothetical protein